MHFIKKLKTKHGQSLIEILVAVTIGSLIIGSAVVAIQLSLRSGTQVQTVGSATPFVSSLIDSVKSSAEGDFVNLYTLPAKGAGSKYYFVRDNTLKIIEGEEGVLGEDVALGLFGHWKLDEGGATPPLTVYDNTTNNRKGTMSGTVAASTRQGVSGCRIGRCILFNGTDNYVGVPSFAPVTTNELTISAWINPSAFTANHTIVGQASQINPYVWFYIRVAGSMNFQYHDGSTTKEAQAVGMMTGLTGTWTHVTVTANYATGVVKFYRNGVLFSQSTGLTMLQPNVARAFNIGAYSPTLHWFNGKIDDVRIYNRVVSDAEAAQLYGSKIYNRSFSVENVNRDACGRGNITSAAQGTCTTGNEVLEDPSTQKVVATVTPVGTGAAINATEYIVRSKNSTNLSTDWSGVADGAGVYAVPTKNYSSIDAGNPVDVTTTPGSITLPP